MATHMINAAKTMVATHTKVKKGILIAECSTENPDLGVSPPST